MSDDHQPHTPTIQQQQWEIGVLTISDRVSRGQAIDHSGPEILNIIKEQLRILINDDSIKLHTNYRVVSDDIDTIRQSVQSWCQLNYRLIVTTGGTGFSDRDVTPEAIEPLLTKKTPGIVIAMIKASLDITPHAMLSRPVAGIVNSTLVITLPGSVKAVRENLTTILPSLPHALALLNSSPNASLPSSHQSKDYNNPPHQHSTSSSPSTTHSSSLPPPPPQDPSSGCQHHHNNRSSCGGNSKRGSTYPMIEVGIAIDIIIKQSSNVMIDSTSRVDLLKSLGMVVAQDITSAINFPPFRASIKDGYAVRSKDGAGKYTILGSSVAGGGDAAQHTLPDRIHPRCCVRITTGAMIPHDDFDAVVMIEDTELLPNTDNQEMVEIEVTVHPNTDIRAIGGDIQAGTKILSKGDRITSADIGLLATLGHTNVLVYNPPNITIISTGDELVSYDTKEEDIKAGYIRDSNSATLMTLIQETSQQFGECGGRSVSMYGIVKDDSESLLKAIESSALESQIIITSGGVSMGQLDLVKPLLEKIGTVHFGRVNMKPGKPLTFASITNKLNNKKTLVFALPGNPVSTMVTYYLFVLPALRFLSGHPKYNLPIIQVKLAERIRADRERPEYHRVMIEYSQIQQCMVSRSTGSQASCRLLSMKSANALLIIPQQDGYIEKDTIVDAIIISNL